MKNSKKSAKILAILLTVILLATFILPAFAMLAGAEELPVTQENNSDSQENNEEPTESTVPSYNVNANGSAFIISFSTADGNLLQQGVAKDVKITVSDQRVSFAGCDTNKIGININASANNFSSSARTYIIDSNTTAGIMYTITFKDFTYLGGDVTLYFDVAYTYDNVSVPVPLQAFEHTVTQIAQPTPTPAPTPTPTPAINPIEVDASRDVFIQSYKISDKSTGKELTTVNPNTAVKIRYNVIDNRVTYTGEAPTIRARMAQGAFYNKDHGDVRYEIMNVGTINGRKILAYQVTFDNVVYQGGTAETTFDVSYKDSTGLPVAVPYTELKQRITQAVDSVPEPKVILNSANYGGVAYVDKAFTLSTIATNTSEYLDLENVSVRVELPAGIAMASGNSQALVGKVSKNGTIKHDFNLVVTGVESNVTSLPVNVVYEFEAYVQGIRKTYTTQHSVAINLEQETKFEISKLEYMEAITAGEEDVITVYLLNKGKTSANNVTIEIQSAQLNGPQTVFAGNIVPGTESVQDIYFTVNETGMFSGKVVVTYENTKGKQSTMEKEFSMEVMEGYNYQWDEPVYDTPVIVDEPTEFSWIAVCAAVAVVVAVTAVIIVKKKRKSNKNAEDEDEDI